MLDFRAVTSSGNGIVMFHGVECPRCKHQFMPLLSPKPACPACQYTVNSVSQPEGVTMRLYNTDKLRELFNAVMRAQVEQITHATSEAAIGFNTANQEWEEYLIKGEAQNIESVEQARTGSNGS